MAYPTPQPGQNLDASLIKFLIRDEDNLLVKISHALDNNPAGVLAGGMLDELVRIHRRMLATFVAVPAECLQEADTMLRARVAIDLRLRKIHDRHLRGDDIVGQLRDLIGAWYQLSLEQHDALATR